MSSSIGTGSSTGLNSTSDAFLPCTADNAGNNNLADDCIYAYFVFQPNKAANIFFLVFFLLLTIAIGYQAIRSRQHWLHALTLFGAIETAGYIARLQLLYSVNNTAFTAELVLIILAPNALAFCCYVVLGKIITYVFQTHSDGKTVNWLTRHPSWVPTFYLCSDLLCIIIQGAGGGILSGANTSSELNTGKGVELTGLALQLFFIGTFLLICLYVWRKMRQQVNGAELTAKLQPGFLALIAIISLLVIRNIYRSAEFGSGGFTTGYFQQNEAWYLAFDPTLMSLALLIAIVFDFTKRLPAELLNGSMVGGAMNGLSLGGKKGAAPKPTGAESEMVHVSDATVEQSVV